MALPALPSFRFGVPGILALAFVSCATAPQSDSSSVENPANDMQTEPSLSDASTPLAEMATEPTAVDPAVVAVSGTPDATSAPLAAPAAPPAEGETSEITEDAEARWKLKVQQLQLQAEESYVEGQKAFERGDYNKAQLYFENALNHTKWAPVGVEWGDLPQRAAQGLEDSTRALERQEVSQQREREEQAFEKLKAEEQAARAASEAQIATMLMDGIAAFNRADYKEAERLADEVMGMDPHNRRAANLKASSIEYARGDYNESALQRRRDEFRRMKQDIEESRVPYADILTGPDKDAWRKITQMRGNETYLAIGEEAAPDRELRQRLKSTVIAMIQFPDVAVVEALNQISIMSAIPIVIAPDVKSELESAATTLNIPALRDISVADLLENITKQAGEGYTYTISSGVVKVMKKEAVAGSAIPRVHTALDISIPLTAFAGPKIGRILPPGSEIPEDQSPFGTEKDEGPVISLEAIINMIKENIAVGTWDTGNFSIAIAYEQSGQILVVHTPEVHREIATFLDDLRKFTSTVVTIESRFVNIHDNFLQELGVDWRGLGGSSLGTGAALNDVTNGPEDNAGSGSDNGGPGPNLGSGLSPVAGAFFNDGTEGDMRVFIENMFTQTNTATGEVENQVLGKALTSVGGLALQVSILDGDEFNAVVRAVEKSQFTTEVSAPIITLFNTQKANVNVVNQVSYVEDFDVDVANSAFIANPNIGILQEGVVLDVRPVISFDRKYVTLEVDATVANIVRPIREFSTSLSGLSIPVTFQLPELAVQQARTTVRVPDGGSAILGGLKRLRYVNRTAEVPWLGRIPVVGVLFRNKGLSDENGSLIVIVKANITELTSWRELYTEANAGG